MGGCKKPDNHRSPEISSIDRNSSIKKEKIEIVWEMIGRCLFLHLGALYGLYLTFTSAKLSTLIIYLFINQLCIFGIGAGAHRLWSHRSYKAKLPLRIILIICQTIAIQNSAYDWARDHRMHHKYSETDADPHNSKRGFFFSHMGWLLVRKHSDLKSKGKNIDTSDLDADPILVFQRKHIVVLVNLSAAFVTYLPIYLVNETLINAFFVNVLRYALSLHQTWLINSVAHMWGLKPYDKYIAPSQNIFVSFFTGGEGWHNYHHTFPWDYKASEIGDHFNSSAWFIRMCAKIGWAYDLKTVTDDLIKRKVKRSGDGTHEIWGWGDKDQHIEDYKYATVINAKGR